MAFDYCCIYFDIINCISNGIYFQKIARINTETAILSVIPGALTQMLVMAEQDKRANLLVVSLTQTSRIIFVVVLVPFISYFFHDGNMHANGKLTKVLPLSQSIKHRANSYFSDSYLYSLSNYV